MKRYKESCGAEITVLLASFGVHRAGAGLRRVLEGQNLRRGQKEKKGRKKRRRLQRTRSGPIDGKDFLKGNANVHMQVLEDRVRACVAFFFLSFEAGLFGANYSPSGRERKDFENVSQAVRLQTEKPSVFTVRPNLSV